MLEIQPADATLQDQQSTKMKLCLSHGEILITKRHRTAGGRLCAGLLGCYIRTKKGERERVFAMREFFFVLLPKQGFWVWVVFLCFFFLVFFWVLFLDFRVFYPSKFHIDSERGFFKSFIFALVFFSIALFYLGAIFDLCLSIIPPLLSRLMTFFFFFSKKLGVLPLAGRCREPQ